MLGTENAPSLFRKRRESERHYYHFLKNIEKRQLKAEVNGKSHTGFPVVDHIKLP